jgi:hypothetical protein
LIRAPSPPSPLCFATRLFASNKNKINKKKNNKKLSSKQRRKRESEKAKRRNEWLAREQKLKRQKNLHPAAKMKRVLSATDYWFSDVNLRTDAHLQGQLHLHKGYVRTAGAIVNLSEIPALGRFASLVSSLYPSGCQNEVQSHY